jgi:hypothetical protein
VFFSAARRQGTTQWDSPKYFYYSRVSARLLSFVTWPADATQKAEKLSNGGFFYTGKILFINKSIFVTRKIHFL